MLRRAFSLCIASYACVGMKVHAQPAPDPLQAATERFLRLAEGLRHLPPADRHAAANRRINELVDYAPDLELCGARDCWQTPAETLASGRGDCEDYAIAKYFLLEACGSSGCPRLVYASWASPAASAPRVAHIALIADAHDLDPVVLDCLDPPLQPLSHRTDLRPVFSFDSSGLWRGADGQRLGDAAVRLRPWRGVLVRWALQQRATAVAH